MKRDYNLIRLLLIEIEKSEEMLLSSDLRITEYDSEQIAYHAALLVDAGLIEGADSSTCAGTRFVIHRLTFAGHDFLDAIRSATVWRKTCDRIQNAGGSFVLSLVKDVALSILHNELKL